MSMSKLTPSTAIVAVLGCVQSAWADVTVRFDPTDSVVGLGDVFTVDIIADIPDPVLGWGLDVAFDPSILSQVGLPAIGSSWIGAPTLDGDGLGGLAFPFPIVGSDVRSATLTLSADAGNPADVSGHP